MHRASGCTGSFRPPSAVAVVHPADYPYRRERLTVSVT